MKTAAERKQDERDRKKAAGLKRWATWATYEEIEKLKEFQKTLRKTIDM